MQVETFECVETAAEPIEASEEAIQIAKDLGLEGQAQLTCKTKSGHPTRSPYREITEEEDLVYRVLCPETKRIEKYSASPIPLRVLQIAAHAKQCFPNAKLIVRDRESVAVKDPVLVCEIPSPSASWQTITYILARWGETLETFSVLRTRAIQIARETLKQTAQACLSRVESMSDGEVLQRSKVEITDRK